MSSSGLVAPPASSAARLGKDTSYVASLELVSSTLPEPCSRVPVQPVRAVRVGIGTPHHLRSRVRPNPRPAQPLDQHSPFPATSAWTERAVPRPPTGRLLPHRCYWKGPLPRVIRVVWGAPRRAVQRTETASPEWYRCRRMLSEAGVVTGRPLRPVMTSPAAS